MSGKNSQINALEIFEVRHLESGVWVKDSVNLFYFSKNKTKNFLCFEVTIAGESAGSMSVMALYLSNAAKGLFHGAIAQSMVLNMPMMYEIEPPINQLRQVCQT